MLDILDGSIPTNFADLIIYYLALCHICYIYSIPAVDPFQHDKKGSAGDLEEVYREHVMDAVRNIATMCNAYWTWYEKRHNINIWPTPEQAHKKI